VSDTDKAKNKIQDLGGQAKEALGKVTGDKSTNTRASANRRSLTSKTLARRLKRRREA